MDKSKKIRFAVIGTNFIVKRFLEAGSFIDEFEFASLYSRSMDKGRAFVRAMEGTQVFGSPQDVQVFDNLHDLAGDGTVDAVYIASPTCCHASQSILMLESGKHVLCEKPVASNSMEWKNMINAAEANNRILLEAMRPLFTPGYQAIKERLEKIAPIRKVNFSFCQYSSRYDHFKAGIIENAFRPELSNGALMDLGVYCIEALVGLFGKPEKISAEGLMIPDSIDGMGKVTALYDGMQAELIYSKIADSGVPCEIRGENGAISFHTVYAPRDIRIDYGDGSVELVTDYTKPHDMIHEIEAFINMIRGSSLEKYNKTDPAEYNKISAAAAAILDESRKQIGIVFPADSDC